MTPIKIYLAGPDVFRPDAREHGAHLRALCAKHGAEGLYPLDGEEPAATVGGDLPYWIRRSNMELIRMCDALVANMIPFRGPSMDTGTAYEMGVAAAWGKIVVGYTPILEMYPGRVLDFYASTRTDALAASADGMLRDPNGDLIESFIDPGTGTEIELVDNLMMGRGVQGMDLEVEAAIVRAIGLVKR
jgi:nucleoside 2-deoxyribosyltransferase